MFSSNLETVNIEKIDSVFVPLKESDRLATNCKIGIIEGMRDFNIQHFTKINQTNDKLFMEQIKNQEIKNQQLIMNDNIFTRVFVGGISIFGLYVLYNFLYKSKNK